MHTYDVPRRTGFRVWHIIVACALVVLAALCLLSVTLYLSASRAQEHLEHAKTSYDDAVAKVDAGDFSAALYSARMAVDSLSKVDDELNTTPWHVASYVPILGDDVRIAQELAFIVGRLTDDALQPIIDEWDSITGGSSLADVLDELPNVGSTIDDAKQAIYECEERLNALPESHFGELNEAAKTLRETTTSVANFMRGVEKIAQSFDPSAIIDTIGEGIDELLDDAA